MPSRPLLEDLLGATVRITRSQHLMSGRMIVRGTELRCEKIVRRKLTLVWPETGVTALRDFDPELVTVVKRADAKEGA